MLRRVGRELRRVLREGGDRPRPMPDPPGTAPPARPLSMAERSELLRRTWIEYKATWVRAGRRALGQPEQVEDPEVKQRRVQAEQAAAEQQQRELRAIVSRRSGAGRRAAVQVENSGAAAGTAAPIFQAWLSQRVAVARDSISQFIQGFRDGLAEEADPTSTGQTMPAAATAKGASSAANGSSDTVPGSASSSTGNSSASVSHDAGQVGASLGASGGVPVHGPVGGTGGARKQKKKKKKR